MLLAWRRIAVHLRPAHPLKLHDWVRERGAAHEAMRDLRKALKEIRQRDVEW